MLAQGGRAGGADARWGGKGSVAAAGAAPVQLGESQPQGATGAAQGHARDPQDHRQAGREGAAAAAQAQGPLQAPHQGVCASCCWSVLSHNLSALNLDTMVWLQDGRETRWVLRQRSQDFWRCELSSTSRYCASGHGFYNLDF